MTKRSLKAKELQILKREIHFLEETEIITLEQSKEIQDLYEVKDGLSFTKTLLYVGSILIGAGILSFIASNWGDIGKLAKFILILGLFIGSNFAGFKMEIHYPKTSRSFYYLGVLVFGAGIFLIGQMFNFGGDFQDAFLWWSLGILPLALVLKDKWILMLASLFVLIYMSDEIHWVGANIPYWVLLWITAIYLLNEKIGFSKVIDFITGVQLLVFIGTIMNFFTNGHDEWFYVNGLLYLLIGLALVLTKVKLKDVYITLGYLVHGAAAFLLSFEDVWPKEWMNIPFSLLYLFFLLYLIKKGSLLSIVILCVMIFRFYLDISFAFLPKSFVFIIGGLLLLGFGFYFERQRKKGGAEHE